MQMPLVLLAKNPVDPCKPGVEETLIGHTSLVCQMAELLTREPPPCIVGILSQDPDGITSWRQSVWLGAWLHDWGKANSHFQRMFLDSSFKQGVRHETISLALTRHFSEWLKPIWTGLPYWAKAGALFATSGHHLKFPDPAENSRQGLTVTVYLSHKDFKRVLELGRQKFNLQKMSSLNNLQYSLLTRGDLGRNLNAYQRELDHDFSQHEKLLIASVKLTVMAADLAGSALPGKIREPAQWLSDRLGRSLTEEQLQQVVEKKLGGRKPRPFQEQVRDARCNTVLVEAGCGSGKTAAAYLWASRHAEGKRLFLCYPTTATASEGFSGYLYEPDFDAILVHSRATLDYNLLDNMPAPSREEIQFRLSRLEALETWPVPVVVCTAHTVLGLMENVRRGLYAWPSLSRAVFIFDEVHSFSDRLFSYLMRFLEVFYDTPMLLMTATLLTKRKKAIESICAGRGGLQVITGPKQREKAQRYQICLGNINDTWAEVEKVLTSGGKVLWVSNTINRAMKLADEALLRKLPVCIYHSRYRYKDRLAHQREVIDGFALEMPAMLAVTTQVAEMSLDLSADLLVSDWAPIPAMIQRLGRLNRFVEIPTEPAKAIFLEPESRLPYVFNDKSEEEKLWIDTVCWLERLSGGEARSQQDLAKVFNDITGQVDKIPLSVKYCELLDGLWQTRKDRRAIEEAGYTIEVIREEDIDRKMSAENCIPMPFPSKVDWKKWRRDGRYLIAPKGAILYDPFKGATWKRD